jgi:hypothetical protein
MKFQPIVVSIALLVAGFVIAGDRLTFLPDPVRTASGQSRQFVAGLWPDWIKPSNRDSQREQQVQELEK